MEELSGHVARTLIDLASNAHKARSEKLVSCCQSRVLWIRNVAMLEQMH